MHCNDCSNLEISFIRKLLKFATELKYLYITKGLFTANDVIKIAIEETKKRTNNVVLDLEIESTNEVNYDEINDTSPLLHLSVS